MISHKAFLLFTSPLCISEDFGGAESPQMYAGKFFFFFNYTFYISNVKKNLQKSNIKSVIQSKAVANVAVGSRKRTRREQRRGEYAQPAEKALDRSFRSLCQRKTFICFSQLRTYSPPLNGWISVWLAVACWGGSAALGPFAVKVLGRDTETKASAFSYRRPKIKFIKTDD